MKELPHKLPNGEKSMPKAWKLRNVVKCPICNVQKAVMGSVWFFCCGKRHDLKPNTAQGEIKTNDGTDVKKFDGEVNRDDDKIQVQPIAQQRSGNNDNSSVQEQRRIMPKPILEIETHYKKVEEMPKEESKQEEAQCGDCHSNFKYDPENEPTSCPNCGVEFE